MTNITNLAKCKEVAQFLLSIKPRMDELGIVMQHPIIKNDYFPFVNGNLCLSTRKSKKDVTYISIVENKNAYQQVIEIYRDVINNSKDYFELLYLINHPYRILYIKLTRGFLSKEDFGSGLICAWVETEMPELDMNVSKEEYVKLFKMSDKKYLMEENELEKYNNLDTTITIYRGVNSEYNNVKALSWSLSIDVAKMFATRFYAKEGTVYEAKIDKENILVYTNCRKEQEIIVDYTKLYDIKPLICNVTK